MNFKQKALAKMLKNIRAPKDLTVQAARNALQHEQGFKALTLEQQEGTLRIFDEEWVALIIMYCIHKKVDNERGKQNEDA